MATATNLLVKDNSATPVEFIFEPESDGSDFFAWRTNIAGVPLAGQQSVMLTKTKTKTGYKLTKKTVIPVMETLGASGASSGYVAPPKVAYTTTHIESLFIDNRSTGQDRINALKIAIGLTQGAGSVTGGGVLTNVINWDGSQTVPKFFKDLLLPN